MCEWRAELTEAEKVEMWRAYLAQWEREHLLAPGRVARLFRAVFSRRTA